MKDDKMMKIYSSIDSNRIHFELDPDFDRVLKVLKHEEPDRVPIAEVAMGYGMMSRFLDKPVTDDDIPAQAEFWYRAGYDYIPLTVGLMRPGGVTRDSQISKVIERTLVKDEDVVDEGAWNVWKRSRIHNEADFEVFPWEEMSQPDLSKFYEVQPYLRKGMKIIATNGKIFTMTWMLMGFENFCVNLILKPDFVAKVVEKIARIQLDGIRNVASIPNVAGVWAVDDIAFKSGPIISPRAYQKFIFPWYEEFVHIAHQNNLKVFFHTDGVLWDLLEDLMALGIDALHPIDPTCMDIVELKAKAGKRVTLVGNIPNQVLEDGTPEEVVNLTKERLRVLAPGGGYMLGSGNSVTDVARLENYLAMLETNRQYGRYPINLTN